MKKLSSGSSIINYVHRLPVIAPRKGEEFDFSVSNDVSGVKISNYLYILEIISYFMSDPFTLVDLDLLTNSYMIACTDTQEHTLGSDIDFIGSDMILF